jgi:hypothetical protein
MRHRTVHLVSPRYLAKKLEPPFYRDVVDVFEDRMLHWLISPAKGLLQSKWGDVPAVALAINYFEAIEIYHSGADSNHRSREFFERGFFRVFTGFSGPDYMRHAVASALYDHVRCGFAHEGTFRHGIYFSTVRKEPFTITWPKKDGELNPKGELETAIVNAHAFLERIEDHFRDYVRQLRRPADSELKECFKAAVDLKWNLTGRERNLGLTEEEFYGGAA